MNPIPLKGKAFISSAALAPLNLGEQLRDEGSYLERQLD